MLPSQSDPENTGIPALTASERRSLIDLLGYTLSAVLIAGLMRGKPPQQTMDELVAWGRRHHRRGDVRGPGPRASPR